MTDANKEAVDATKASHKTLASEYVFGIKVAAYDEDIETPYGPVKRYCSHWSTPGKGAVNVRRLFAEEDVLALLSERDQLRTQLHTTHNAGLDAAINCINEFLSSERIGSHEYVKGQTECMLHLLDKISAMKSEGN